MTPEQLAIRVMLSGPSLQILGGQAVQARRLVDNLRHERELEVAFLPVNPMLPGALRHLQRIKYVRTIVTSLFYIFSLLRHVPRIDILHTFSASYWSFLLAPAPAILVGRCFGKRVLLNYRSGEAEDHLRRSRRVAVPLMRLAHRIVVPSGYLVEVFGRFGLPAVAIPNFVDTTAIRFRGRVAPRPRFLSNRNFESLYNVAMTVRAFARIQAEVPEAELVLVGQGGERPSLERLVHGLGLRGVTFTGPVPPDRMPAHYDECDIYLNSPDIDNMPTSVIEAFAAGLPVITTRAGGIPWVVRHNENGLVVDCNDDEGMAAAALSLLRESGLGERLSRTAIGDVHERYTWEAVRPSWVGLYEDMVQTGCIHT